MLIRPQQALLLARIYCKLFVFKYTFGIYKEVLWPGMVDKGEQSELLFAYSHFVQNTLLWKLQVAKVGLIK